MSYLSFINDDDLVLYTKKILDCAISSIPKAESQFNKNVVDPFSAMFEMSAYELDFDRWKQNETLRKAQKTISNALGDFHQNLLGSFSGWRNLGVGEVVDLECLDRKIIAEVKNKFNTVKGSNLKDIYHSLEDLICPRASKYHDFTAFYVELIPKKAERFDRIFVPSDNTKGGRKCEPNMKIRVIDGVSFYDLASGTSGALAEVFKVLPSVIAEISTSSGQELSESSITSLSELFQKAFPN